MSVNLPNTKTIELENEKQGIDSVLVISYILYALHLILNYLGSGLIQYLYLVETFFVLICIMAFHPKRAFIPLIMYFFVEGQGRVVWSYAQWTRLTVDFFLILMMAKSFRRDPRIFPLSVQPKMIYFATITHFLICMVQVFNPLSPSPLMQIISFKTYILPFIICVFLIKEEIFKDSVFLNTLKNFTLFAVIGQCLIVLHQTGQGEEHLFGISEYYRTLLGEKTGKFTGISFRPTGTTFLPGGASYYIFLTTGLVFISPIRNIKNALFLLVYMILSSVTLFLGQIRSALLKFGLIIFLSSMIILLISRAKMKNIFLVFVGLSLLVPFIFSLEMTADFVRENNLQSSFERLMSITSDEFYENSGRVNIDNFIDLVKIRLDEVPFGLGPGRTGAAGRFFEEEFRNNAFYNEQFSWHYENYYVSVFTDLGYTSLPYFFLLFILPVYFLYYAIRSLIHKKLDLTKQLMISSMSLVVILSGNWASATLGLLPESFLFWIYAAIGMTARNSFKEFMLTEVDQATSSPSDSSEESPLSSS